MPNNNEIPYVAFLRGINVGGNNLIKMDALKKAFEGMGFKNVKTLLASGNVAFTSKVNDATALAGKIEEDLEAKFGTTISVILRTLESLQKLSASKPFKGIEVTQDIRLYVTFLSGEKPKGTLEIPYRSPAKDFQILKVTKGEVFSVADLGKGARTVDSMNVLEKEFGRKVTTRNWNTIEKVLK